MKKLIVTALLLSGVVGFAQTTKKKVYKKPVKKTYVKKAPAKAVKPKEPELQILPPEPIENAVGIPPTVETVIAAQPVVEVSTTPDYELTAQKVAKKKGWINNRNSAYERGIEGFVKGIYTDKNNIYVLLELDNKKNIDYDIESIAFYSTLSGESEKIQEEDKYFVPVWSNQKDVLPKKSSNRFVFVFDKFTIAENKDFVTVVSEQDGERTLNIPVRAKHVTNAEFIK